MADSALYTVANFATRVASLGALAILPLFLDIRDYGVIGIVGATAAFVNIIVPLEVSQGLARLYATAPHDEQRIMAGSAWWFTLAMLAAAAIVALLFARPLSMHLFGAPGLALPFSIAVLYWFGNTAFVFLQNQFRWSFRPRQYAAYSLLFACGMLLFATVLAVVSPDPLVGALGGWAGAAIGVTALALVSLRTSLATTLSRAQLARMLKFSLPLVPASIAIVVTTYFSRIVLGSKVGLAEVGLFTFASQLAAIPSFVILGVQSALTPYVMANFEQAQTPGLLARLFEVVVLLGLAGSLCLAVLADDLLRLIGYEAYVGAGGLILLLGPALLVQQLYIFSPGFAIAQRTGHQALVSIATGALAVAMNYALIDAIGTRGAALATLLAALIFLATWFSLAHRHYPVPVRWIPLAGALLAMIAASQLHNWVPQPWGRVAGAFGVLVALALAWPVWGPAIAALRGAARRTGLAT